MAGRAWLPVTLLGFDPLLPENWYGITKEQLSNQKVQTSQNKQNKARFCLARSLVMHLCLDVV